MKLNKADSGDLALFACLRYEEATLMNVTDFQERWNITEDERQVVLKWMANRMDDIKERT